MVTDVIFDIDGTLANAEHRLHFIQKSPKDWDSFLSDEQTALDTPIEPTWRTLAAYVAQGYMIWFITGRPERQREITEKWLFDERSGVRGAAFSLWNGSLTPHPRVLMRKNGDRRPSHEVKRDIYRTARDQEGLTDAMIVFEDRKDDTAMWRAEGLLCCQVAEGNY